MRAFLFFIRSTSTTQTRNVLRFRRFEECLRRNALNLTHPRSGRSGRVFDRGRDALVARGVRFSPEPTPPVSPETPAFRFRGGGRRRRARRQRAIVLGTFRDGFGAYDDASLGRQQHVRPREVNPHPRPQNAQHQARAAGHAVRSHPARAPRSGLSSLMSRFRRAISAKLFRDGGETRDARYGSLMTAPMCINYSYERTRYSPYDHRAASVRD